MTTSDEQLEQMHFENEVRRIARQLWPEAQYEGASMVDGHERDGIFQTEECVHLLEATVSRSKSKAVEDGKKLVSLAKRLQSGSSEKAVKCWFVTKDEPTAEQREVIKQHHGLINSVSFAQFQSRLIDAPSYLNLRENYPFGSVRDPATGDQGAQIEYVTLDLLQAGNGKLWNTTELRDSLLQGGRVVVLGDYGAGKSMTLRELHRHLRKTFFNGRTPRFPLYLNLRNHFGQTNASEVLERHARNIGFPNPAHLVRAWRAGYAILLLDGFDELNTSVVQGVWRQLHDTRFRAMQLIREFVRDQPAGAGIVLSGRAHFFDSAKERRNALSIQHSSFVELSLNEFTDEQIKRYLEKSGLKAKVPSWMPSRPLLVGYLAASGVLDETFAAGNSSGNQSLATDPAIGWNIMLDKICAREAEIEAGIDGQTVRRILERLATKARATQSGFGPLSQDQVVSAFLEICGYQPDERGLVILQRLPGLGIDRADEGTRIFLDESLVDVCRAGDLSEFISDPFGQNAQVFRGAEFGLGNLGLGVCVLKVEERKISTGKLNSVLQKVTDAHDSKLLQLDLVRLAMELDCKIESQILLRDLYVPSLELSGGTNDFALLKFQGCLFSHLALDAEVRAERLPRFEGCYIDELEGRASLRDLPAGVFDAECEIHKFSEAGETTDAIKEMDLPLGTRVLLTVLRKIYLRAGSGRKENALFRGLDHHGRRMVQPVLRILQSEGLIAPYKRSGDMTVWVPDRTQTARVNRMIASPRTCGDELLEKVAELS